MKNWRLSKQDVGKWLRLCSILVIAITLLVVLVVTNGALAAPHQDQKATGHKEASNGSILPFKQRIMTSPDYSVRQGTKSYTQACPSNTTLTGGGYQLLKGRSAVTFPASYPSTTNSSAWTVVINNPSSDEATFRVYAICLAALPPDPTPTPRPTPVPSTPTQVVQPTPSQNNGNNGNSNNNGNGNNNNGNGSNNGNNGNGNSNNGPNQGQGGSPIQG